MSKGVFEIFLAFLKVGKKENLLLEVLEALSNIFLVGKNRALTFNFDQNEYA